MKIATLAATALLALSAVPASADRGKSDNGDSYLNDLQKRPDLIEPYAGQDPSRYRISNPQAGYEDRQLAREGYVNDGSGYRPPRARGRVSVQPYYSR
jgi:hypothetical protein